MPSRDDEIADAVVTVRPDTTGFKASLEAQLKKALTGIEPTIKVKLVADGAGLKDSVKVAVAKQQALSNQPVYKVKVVADAGGFLTTVRNELRKQKLLKQPEYKVKVTADVRRGSGDGGGGRGGGGRSKEERDAQKAEREAEKAEAELYRRLRKPFEKFDQAEQQAYDTLFRRLRGTYDAFDKAWQDAHAEDRRRTKTVEDAEVAATAKTEAQKTKIAEQEARQRARIAEVEAGHAIRAQERVAKERERQLKDVRKTPTLIDFGGEGVRPMNLLYGAVAALTPALFAMGTSAVQAASSVAALGAAGTGAALGISALAISFSSISEVLKLRQSANNSALVKTAKSVGVGAADQARSLRDLANAQRDEKAAYAAIHDARREAVRDLQDLRQAVIDLDNEYKSNKLSVAEAEQNEAATNRNFFATALDRARAHQDTLDARSRLSGTELQRKQKREDLARSVKSGVEGSDKVLQARERARDARDRRLDLQASKGKGAAAGLDGASAAAAQLEQKIKDLSLAGQDMYYWFVDNEEVLKKLRRTIEQGTLPGFTTFLREVTKVPKGGKSTLQLAAEYAGELGGIIGKYAGRFGKFTNTPLFRKDMAIIQKNNAKSLNILGKAAETSMKPLLRIFTAASPLLVKFADKLLDLAIQFDTFIEKAEKNGSLTKWFEDTAEQAKQWWRILSNAGRFLRDLFTAAKPSGGSLVKDFADYMERLANWSSSEEGQKSIKDFFDKIASLPYAQIRDMLVSLSELFLAKHVASWARANPLFTAIGVLIASNPALATSFLKTLTYFVETGARIVAANPGLTAMLLAMVALAKLNKATGGALFAVTGLDKLKDVLTGKFKVLDKFLGGGAATSVMNVRAGVVHVYGASIGGVGGAPVPGGGKSPAGKAGKVGGAAAGVAGGFWGTVITATLWSIFGEEGQKLREYTQSFTIRALALAVNNLKPESLAERIKDPIGTTIATAIGIAAKAAKLAGIGGDGKPKLGARVTAAMGAESYAMGRVKNVSQWAEKGSPVFKAAIDNYVEKRRTSVQTYVDWVRSTKGPIAAADAQVAEDRKSSGVLAGLMRQYGYSKSAAKVYADQVFGLSAQTKTSAERAKDAATQYDSMGNALQTAGGKAKGANTEVSTLKDTVKATFGPHVMTLSTKNYPEVKKQLDLLYATQHVLYNPNYSNSVKHGADTISSQNQFLDPKTGLPKRYMKAGGGHIRGPGTATSDSIPARLSDGEYVLPTKAVDYYGVSTLEAMRQRRVPKFATGGGVDRSRGMPFIVNLPMKGFQFPDVESELPGYPDGALPGYSGKIPKGIGNVNGVIGQVVAAVLDAKKIFPQIHVTSGLRKTMTSSHRKSNHWFGHAADIAPPSMALFEYLKRLYGRFAREIIYTPAGHRQVYHGKNHLYQAPDVVKGHYNHIHLALAQGGLVQPKKFDTGGVLPPGYTLAFNGTGRNETVRTDRQERQVQQGPVRLDRRDITMLAAAVANTGAASVNMDGRRVAELTNRYNYLPAGV